MLLIACLWQHLRLINRAMQAQGCTPVCCCIGSVRIVITDGVTHCFTHCWPQNPNRTILGPAQTQYLKDQLSAAEVGAGGSGGSAYKG
jgi:hypothetical protein